MDVLIGKFDKGPQLIPPLLEEKSPTSTEPPGVALSGIISKDADIDILTISLYELLSIS